MLGNHLVAFTIGASAVGIAVLFLLIRIARAEIARADTFLEDEDDWGVQ